MQYSAAARVVNGSEFVEFVWELLLASVVGTFTVGETVTFASGATGVLLDDDDAPLYRFAITSVQQPIALDTLTGDTSGATATVTTIETGPNLDGAGVTAPAFLIRDGDSIPYLVASLASNSRVELTAPYAGVSADDATVIVHSTRTPNYGLPIFDRRDRNLPVLLVELVRILDEVLQDHEDRIAALEAP